MIMEGVSHKNWSLIVVLFTQRSIYGFTLHIYILSLESFLKKILSLEYIKLHSSKDNNTLHPLTRWWADPPAESPSACLVGWFVSLLVRLCEREVLLAGSRK